MNTNNNKPKKMNRIYFFVDKCLVDYINIEDLKETYKYISKISNFEKPNNQVVFNLHLNKVLNKKEFDILASYICNMVQKHINIYYQTTGVDKYKFSNYIPKQMIDTTSIKHQFIDDD